LDGSHLPATSGGGGQMRRDFLRGTLPRVASQCAGELGDPGLISVAPSGQASLRGAKIGEGADDGHAGDRLRSEPVSAVLNKVFPVAGESGVASRSAGSATAVQIRGRLAIVAGP